MTSSSSDGPTPMSTRRSTSGFPTGRVLNQPTSSGLSLREQYLQPRAAVVSQLTRSYLSKYDAHPQLFFVLPGNYDHVEGYLISRGSRPSSEEKHWMSQPFHCRNCLPFLPKPFLGGSRFWYNQDVGWSDKYGNTSLHVAAALGACYNVLLYIIRSGVDVKRTNAAGQTFLHVPRRQAPNEWDNKGRNCFAGKPNQRPLRPHDVNEWGKLMMELAERGYDFNHRDVIGRTVWNLVPQIYRNELSVILQNLGIAPDFEYVRTPTIDYIRSPPTKDTIEKLLHEGANINERDSLGQTPLHVSITYGKADITGALLSHKPNLHARDVSGKGVLAAAMDVLRRVKYDARWYAKITACMTLAIDAGAIAGPTSQHEWRLPNYQYWPGDPTQSEEILHGSWPDI